MIIFYIQDRFFSALEKHSLLLMLVLTKYRTNKLRNESCASEYGLLLNEWEVDKIYAHSKHRYAI